MVEREIKTGISKCVRDLIEIETRILLTLLQLTTTIVPIHVQISNRFLLQLLKEYGKRNSETKSKVG